MRQPARRLAAAFTLVELLTVIAIIGILAAIFIPTMGGAMDKAKRTVDSTNAREIIKAASIYAQDNGDKLPDPQNTTAVLTVPQRALWFPGILARNGMLTDPKVWFSKLDSSFSGTYPVSIINTTDVNKRSLDTSFLNKSLCWEFVGGLRNGDSANSPVIYTRGLQTNGAWSLTSGVYKDTGGFVGFLGGNIEFYSNTSTPDGTANPVFFSNNSGRKTANIQQAIPFTPITARLYGIPPTGQAILGTVNGTAAQRGP